MKEVKKHLEELNTIKLNLFGFIDLSIKDKKISNDKLISTLQNYNSLYLNELNIIENIINAEFDVFIADHLTKLKITSEEFESLSSKKLIELVKQRE